MDNLVGIFITILAALIGLLIFYFIIKGAVIEGMKEYLKWEVLNRPLLEAKYAKQRERHSASKDTP